MNRALLANAITGAADRLGFAQIVVEALMAGEVTPALKAVIAADEVLRSNGDDLDAAMEQAYKVPLPNSQDRARVVEAVYGLYYSPVSAGALLMVALEALGAASTQEGPDGQILVS